MITTNIFLHIPKTAGTSLLSILDAQYGRRNVATFYNQQSNQLIENLDALTRARDIDALIGHFYFGVHKRLSVPYRNICFLRDPVQLVQSTYGEMCKGAGIIPIDKEELDQLSFEEVLDKHGHHFRDIQTSFILGHSPETELTSDQLDQALSNLVNEFAFVGLVERFNESILMIGRRLGWKPFLYRRQNVGGKHAPLSEAVREGISELTRNDQVVYDKAVELYDENRSQEPETLTAALAEFENALDQVMDDQPIHFDKAETDGVELPAVKNHFVG